MEEKEYLLLFNLTAGIGPARAKLLIDYFGSAEKTFKASDKKLLETGLSEKLVLEMRKTQERVDPEVRIGELAKKGIKVVTWNETEYPEGLKEIPDPPVVLYVKGEVANSNLADISKKSIAVVGSRRMTSYGVTVTESLTASLVDSGFTIISGMARGVDTLAHKTAIENNGKTIGVLGCGVDLMYPPENEVLGNKIINGSGFLISEFPCGMQAVPGNFPSRNRIISGLSLGVLITEAATDSGSLITASRAAEQGRIVFVVPGSIISLSSAGTNELIKKGAIPVTSVDDILSEFGMGVYLGKKDDVHGDTLEEEKIISVLKNGEEPIDNLCKIVGMEIGSLGGVLTVLELKGKVKCYGGKWSLR